jgi:hypothetical protein
MSLFSATIEKPNVYELIGLVWLAARPGWDYVLACPNDCGGCIAGRDMFGTAFSECVCGACDLSEDVNDQN